LRALLEGHDPYRALTYLGNPPTPMPGALILALPFFLAGDSAFQNLFWMPLFCWWCLKFLGETSAALWCILIFAVGMPASLQDFVTGGDYLVNALYVGVAADLAFVAFRGHTRLARYAAAVLLSVAISSRPTYVLVVPILAGSIWQHRGWKGLAEFLCVVVAICGALNLPFFLHDPGRFPTAHLSQKSADLPAALHANLLLPVLGVAIGSFSFLMKMSRARLFGLLALSLAPLFYIILAYRFFFQAGSVMEAAAYTLPVSLFAGLWIAARGMGRSARVGQVSA